MGGEEPSFLRRARIMFGIFMVATLPEAQRRMWSLLSFRWEVESKGSTRVS